VVSDHVALEEAARELHVVDGSALGAPSAAGAEVVASAA
jgi:hypothetical protein